MKDGKYIWGEFHKADMNCFSEFKVHIHPFIHLQLSCSHFNWVGGNFMGDLGISEFILADFDLFVAQNFDKILMHGGLISIAQCTPTNIQMLGINC